MQSHAHESESAFVGRFFVYQASALSRIWVALIVGCVVTGMLGTMHLAGGVSLEVLRVGLVGCAAFIPMFLVIQPVAYLESGPVRLIRGVRVFGLLVRLKTSAVEPSMKVVLVEHHRGIPGPRQEGWYLCIRLANGRKAWLGYSSDHAKIEARAKPIRAWLGRCRRGKD